MDFAVGLDAHPDEAREAILDGLVAYNAQFLGPLTRQSLVVSARDAAGRLVGGAVGGVYYDRLAVDLLWIQEEHRGAGLGSRVLQAIEAEGKRAGATRSFLDTFGFQAEPFYLKKGYVEVARIPGYFADYDRIYLLKSRL